MFMMSEPRLKTDIWIRAQIRLCDINFIPAVVTRRGDSDAGQVLINLNRLNGTFELFARTSTLDGTPAWRSVTGGNPMDEKAALTFIEREANVDPDIWVLEIEDRDRKYQLDGPVIV
ncbi:MAG: hypothetical protein CFH41_00249 [Alphaproteobacteria bacterium MarineAlpha11_Bin1]|nr:MAG: hypothetical protein CFH41_00249 [Alphaproteobacteria bacterium MarineAlpha11_Bin1]|tara:strand:+ start:21861 stop:22211 length:351 start_codon:yes stop_codon:yes gene_type:complete